MSLLGNLFSKILGHSANAATTDGAASSGTQTASAGGSAASTGTAGGAQVDVAEVLDGMAAKAGQPLNWKTSIVDLMKLVGMDSSITARKELAGELHYSGDTSDSAAMNMWLHKQVMQKLAENGGKLPDDLKHA